MFGRNTPGGVVKFDSAKPESEFGGYVQAVRCHVQHDERRRRHQRAPWATAGRRASRCSTSIATTTSATRSPGEDDIYEGYDDRAARVQLQYENESFSALFNVHMRNLDGTARLFRANIIESGSNDLVDGFDRGQPSSPTAPTARSSTSRAATSRLRWDFGDLALYSITGYESMDAYSRGDIDGGFGCGFCALPNGPGFIPFPSETADAIPTLDQFTQEVRLESQLAGSLNWQAGVYYFDEDYDTEFFSYDSLRRRRAEPVPAREPDQPGLGGVRLRGLRRHRQPSNCAPASATRTTRRISSPAMPVGFTFPDPTLPTTASLSDSNVSWDLAGTFSVNEAVNLYARVAKGFRAASVQPAGPFGNQSVAEPETNTSIEVGVKADLLDRRAKLYFNLFRYEVKDQQLTAVGGANNAVRLLNAEETVGQGAELDFEAYLTPQLLVTLGASYNDTEINDDGIAVGTCFACTVTDPIVGGFAVIDGNRLPQAPEWIANVTLRYGIPVGSGEFFAFTDWAYRSEVNFFLYESIEFTGKELLEGGLRVGYTGTRASTRARCSAATSRTKSSPSARIDFNNLTGFLNEPRIFGVQFKAKF